MKRRDILKLMGIAPAVPLVACADKYVPQEKKEPVRVQLATSGSNKTKCVYVTCTGGTHD